jgi:hypothetical protein
MPWYLYNPIDTFPHNPVDANNYDLIGNTPPSCPSPNSKLCAIQAADNSGNPIITQALTSEMLLALSNSFESTNVLLRPTLYP